jgi:hypothetical protein
MNRSKMTKIIIYLLIASFIISIIVPIITVAMS